MSKTVSLVMTTYNGERFLREQLDSIYNQTLPPDEVIVCDDCSTDGTVDILREYSRKEGLRFFINEASLGVNGNFYKAMAKATSDYIAISDQDDIWLPNKIETTYNKLCEIDDGNPCLVTSLCNNIDAEGNKLTEMPDEHDTQDYVSSLMFNNFAQGCTLMMNRKLLSIVLQFKDLASETGIIYDGFIGMTAAVIGHRYNLGKRLMLYRHHNNNVISKANNYKTSIRNRVEGKNTLGYLFPNVRLKTFSLLYDIYNNDIKDKNILCFLEKAAQLYKDDSFLNELKFIYSLKEISPYEKMKAMFYTSYIFFLKFLFSCI